MNDVSFVDKVMLPKLREGFIENYPRLDRHLARYKYGPKSTLL